MVTEEEYLEKIIELVFTKKQNLIPFVDILRNDINSLIFTEDDAVESANIILHDGKFDIVINTKFIEEYELNDEDVLWLICHEITHYALDHLNISSLSVFNDHVRNIGLDCQVNSLLYNLNNREKIELFEKGNKINYEQFLNNEDREGFYFLTVPPFLTEQEVKQDLKKINYDEKKKELIVEFWFKNFSSEGLGIIEIFEYLKQIFDNPYNNQTDKEEDSNNDKNEENNEGNNETDNNGGNEDNEDNEGDTKEKSEEKIPESVVNLLDDLLKGGKKVKSQTKTGSIENIISETEKQYATKDNITILRNAIAAAMFTKQNNITAINETIIQTVIPNMGRKEAVLLSRGIMPLFYNSRGDTPLFQDIAIYIDFSASTQPYHKKILNLIYSLRDVYSGKYYAFSDKVCEVSLDDLTKGKFDTGGTDLERVFEHINNNNIQKALIISDGEFGIVTKLCRAELFFVLMSVNNSTNDIKKLKNVKKIWFLT
jgi:hypothetical protein